eukprot:tig00020554_g10933.t1
MRFCRGTPARPAPASDPAPAPRKRWVPRGGVAAPDGQVGDAVQLQETLFASRVGARRAEVLRRLVERYVEVGSPVASSFLEGTNEASPATIRLDLAALESSGLLHQPHQVSGRVPSERGYRVYVDSLMEEVRLSAEERASIARELSDGPMEPEAWAAAAARSLARRAGLLTIVTPPRARTDLVYVRAVDAVAVGGAALLVVILSDASILKTLVPLELGDGDEPVPEAELRRAALRIGKAVSGLSLVDPELANQMARTMEDEPADSPGAAICARVAQALLSVLQSERRASSAPSATAIEGLADVLLQPEFASNHQRVLELVSATEDGLLAASLCSEDLLPSGPSVIIGGEMMSTPLRNGIRDCSLLVAPYGGRDDGSAVQGAVALLGPTRLDYAQNLARVRYIAALLDGLAGTTFH